MKSHGGCDCSRPRGERRERTSETGPFRQFLPLLPKTRKKEKAPMTTLPSNECRSVCVSSFCDCLKNRQLFCLSAERDISFLPHQTQQTRTHKESLYVQRRKHMHRMGVQSRRSAPPSHRLSELVIVCSSFFSIPSLPIPSSRSCFLSYPFVVPSFHARLSGSFPSLYPFRNSSTIIPPPPPSLSFPSCLYSACRLSSCPQP
mmetsp:Transcript_12335/g.23922  ORF Transcript_12335/g.23922 Transcript_12335/m.23922 type:complete len:202 (+) Transcript_12335:1512-2117(+)